MEANEMKKSPLNAYEQGIEDAAESLVPVSQETKRRLDEIVEQSRKTKSVNLRFSDYDLERVKA
jgi:predicted DNA binding CopG/RHH family protein